MQIKKNKKNVVHSFHTVFLWSTSTCIHFVKLVQHIIVWNVFGFTVLTKERKPNIRNMIQRDNRIQMWSWYWKKLYSIQNKSKISVCTRGFKSLDPTCQCLKPWQIYLLIYLCIIGTQRCRPHIKFALCVKSCGVTLIIRTCGVRAGYPYIFC